MLFHCEMLFSEILICGILFRQALLLAVVATGSQGVTLYDYFTPGVAGTGITSGLGGDH